MYIDQAYILTRTKQSDLASITMEKGGDSDVIVKSKVNAAITDACADVDNALSQAGYITPVAEPTDYIKRIVYDIATYYLYSIKYNDEEMKDVYVRYNKAFSKLKDIINGNIKLSGVPTISMEGLQSCLVTNKTESNRVFIKKNLERMQ